MAGEENNNLSVQDLFKMKTILDVVCVRGGIHANEMESVGKVYNKLVQLLETYEKNSPSNITTGSPRDVNG